MDLEEQRRKLEALIVSNAGYEEILRQSQMLDMLIVIAMRGGEARNLIITNENAPVLQHQSIKM